MARFSTFPIRKKKPLVKWKKAQKRIVKIWHVQPEPGDGVALVTGKINGILVVDADSPKAVKWCKAHLNYTPMVQQTTRGMHFFYAWEPGLRNTAGFLHHKVDTRGQGGYIRVHDKKMLKRLSKSDLPRLRRKFRSALKSQSAKRKGKAHQSPGNTIHLKDKHQRYAVRDATKALFALSPDCDRNEWWLIGRSYKDAGGTAKLFWIWSDLAHPDKHYDGDRTAWWHELQPMEAGRKYLFAAAKDSRS